MANIPTVPVVAGDANYPAGVDPWSGMPTKVIPPGSYATTGWVPGQPVAAEHENYIKAQTSALIVDTQSRAVVKQCAAGFEAAYSLGAYLPIIRAFCAPTDVSGTQKISSKCPNNLANAKASGTTLANFNDRFAYYRSGNTGKLAMWPNPLVGSTGVLDVVADAKALTHTGPNPPTVNARYTDGCTDVDTENAILVSAVNPGTPAYGVAYGDPAALTWVALGAGWTSDANTFVASKPGGESRAFSVAKTFSITAGGATLGGVTSVVWTGSLEAGAAMIRPTWDIVKARWVTATAKVSVDHDTASSTSHIWTSTDGVTWTKLVDSPDFVFLDVLYYRGWLWACVVPLSYTGHNGHGGIELMYSRDGGTTWTRPGIVVSLVSAGAVTTHAPRIVPCDGVLVIHTIKYGTAANETEWVSVLIGEG